MLSYFLCIYMFPFKIGGTFNLFFFHFCALIVIFFCFYLFINVKIAISCLLGGLVSLISSYVFFLIYFFNKDFYYKSFVRRFYIAGFFKFFTFLSLSILCFYFFVSNVFLFFCFLFLFQVSIWCFLIYYLNRM